MKEVDVRGLSCPEPVMLVTEALSSKEPLKILISEAHTKKNIENLLSSKKVEYKESNSGSDFVLETI